MQVILKLHVNYTTNLKNSLKFLIDALIINFLMFWIFIITYYISYF